MADLIASAQYDDYVGTVAADDADGFGLSALAKKHGVDTDLYFIFAASYYMGENHGRGLPDPMIAVYAVDREVASGFDALNQYRKAHPGPLKCRRFDLKITTDEFLSAFKRFNVVFLRDGLSGEAEFDIQDIEDTYDQEEE